MAAKKTHNTAEKMKLISKALREEIQNKNWMKELADKKAIIEKQQKVAKEKLAEIKAVLDDDKELTAVAREMMATALQLQGSGSSVKIYNPKYVTTEDKESLLESILEDYRAENPKAKSMSFTAIKAVLENRYQIDTPSAGLFFRNQLKEYETQGGNKNKAVVL